MEAKSYYTINDISEFVDENPSTLRFWEKEFDELKPERASRGRRLYTPEDLETIRKIKFLLRTKGMHISAAKEQLRKNKQNISTRTEALNELETLKRELESLLSALKKRSGI